MVKDPSIFGESPDPIFEVDTTNCETAGVRDDSCARYTEVPPDGAIYVGLRCQPRKDC